MKPLISIWIKPRQTFRFLLNRTDEENQANIIFLFLIVSAGNGLSNVSDFVKLFHNNYIVGLLLAIIISGLVGLFFFKFIITWIYWGMGKLLQGEATKKEVELIFAYSLIPHLIHIGISLVLILPAIYLERIDLITYKHPITYVIFGLFTLRNLVFGLSLVNRFSFVYALLNILIPIGILQGIFYSIRFIIQ